MKKFQYINNTINLVAIAIEEETKYINYETQEDSPQQKKLIRERKRNSRLLKELSWFRHRFYQKEIDRYLDEIHDNDKNIDEFNAYYLGEKGI